MIIFHSIPLFLLFSQFYRPQIFEQFKPVLVFFVWFSIKLNSHVYQDLSLHTKVLFCDPKIDILIIRPSHSGLERHQGEQLKTERLFLGELSL